MLTEWKTTFKCTFPVIVNALEYLQTNGDCKSGVHLSALLRFDFILPLVVCSHILHHVVPIASFLHNSCSNLSILEEYWKANVISCTIAIMVLTDTSDDECTIAKFKTWALQCTYSAVGIRSLILSTHEQVSVCERFVECSGGKLKSLFVRNFLVLWGQAKLPVNILLSCFN
jgi:hypothetical protein